MVDKSEALTQKHFDALENIKKIQRDLDARTTEAIFFKARHDNLEFEKQELRAEMLVVKRENAR